MWQQSLFTWKAGSKNIGVKLDYKADDKLRLSLENNMRGNTTDWSY